MTTEDGRLPADRVLHDRALDDRALDDRLLRDRDTLLRLATLLEGDEAAADALVTLALGAGIRSSHRPAPADVDRARRELVRRHLRRSGRHPSPSGWVTEPDPWSPDGDPLRRALDDLPARTRAAAVLHVHEQLPDDVIARLLHCDEPTARADVSAGVARLRAVIPSPRCGDDPWHRREPPDAPDAALRRELGLLAVPRPRPPAEGGAAAASAVREVGRRRRRWWAFPLGAALVAGLAAVPAVPAVLGNDDGPPPAPVTMPAPETLAVQVTDGSGGTMPEGVLDGPPRGSLAGDTAFLAGLVQQPWENRLTEDWPGRPTTTPSSRRVVFAGDVPGGRWALLVGAATDPEDRGEADRQRYTAWFTGPPGAAPTEMELASFPAAVEGGLPPALVDPRTGTLVVVTRPGATVEVSPAPVIEADGTTTRAFEPVETVDGIATTRTPTAARPWNVSLAYRVVEAGTQITRSWPEAAVDGDALDQGWELPDLPMQHLRPRPAGGDDGTPAVAAFTVLGELGLAPDEVELASHWEGDLDMPGLAARASIVTVTVPSGAVVVSSQWSVTDPDRGSWSSSCGQGVRPAGIAASQRVYAAVCEVADWSTPEAVESSFLVVVGPPRVSSVRAYDDGGRFLSEHPASDGVAVLALPPDTSSVEAVTADGVLLGRSPLLGHDVDFGD